ncbi:MAG: hypothetical protein JRE14_17480 [Deltaproteobacteria bacterium]|nr:hypothetical protein [Deltaproteobacteria bacterium]
MKTHLLWLPLLVILLAACAKTRVVWKDTHFILNGDDKSGFVFSDTNPKFRHVPKTPSVVSPGGRLREDLFPAGYASYRIAWDYRTLPKGELGVLVSMQIEGETITELLTLLHDTNIKK